MVGLEHARQTRRARLEDADDEGGPLGGRRVELAAGQPELEVRGGHVRQGSFLEPQTASRGVDDLAPGQPAEALVDHLHRVRGSEERGDVRFGQVERHGDVLRLPPHRRLVLL